MTRLAAESYIASLALAACPDEHSLLACYDALLVVLTDKDLANTVKSCARTARTAEAARDELHAALEAARGQMPLGFTGGSCK